MEFYYVLSGSVAAGLTVLDLDRTFYVPSRAEGKARLWAWWWAFVVLNGVLAGILYLVLQGLAPFNTWSPWLSAVVIGVGYLALIRLKFATFQFQGKETPFGFEAFYEAAKASVFKRINSIARASRTSEAKLKAKESTLKQLAIDARANVMNDALLSEDEKMRAIDWIGKVVSGSNDEEVRKMTLAIFVLSGVQAPV